MKKSHIIALVSALGVLVVAIIATVLGSVKNLV